MFNFYYITNEDIKQHNIVSQKVFNINKILIIGGSGSGKINALLNVINHEPDIDKINLYANIFLHLYIQIKQNINY